ncbi:branched chain amino acid ABC transporter substrate-binding protein [Dissulfurispira thermophila]|uniref:Branched chain amino acid ABC transporter substrate-binding protein n=2 Tax=root TaxID=1 RepID=A0A7G1H3A7_9BACT|nr:branched-chain amino acid ABC transporter substrate-binding protein [Dissulfurispira thermophila]BCB97198.1 branched chain amino acid ABC transporter substrate-binding protein [Dissulfurispira thermophila]
MKRFFVFLIAVFSITMPFYGCKKKDDTIKIGIAGPMTGPQAKMGNDFRNGVAIAVEEWNSKGGVLGKKIDIIIGDDQSDPKQAVSVANKLVNEGVAGIVGHFNSSCSIPASDVYNRAGIPMITPASTNPQLTERGYRGIFRVCGRDDQQGKVAAIFAMNKLKIKKLAIIHDKTTYGQGLADEFKKNLSSAVEIVYYGGITQGDKDFKTILTSIKEKKPEMIYFGGIYPETGLLVKQSREISLNIPFMSGDGSIDPKFIEIAGEKAAEGTYLTFSPDPKNIPAAKEFLEKYSVRFGDVGPYSIYAYDAMNILLTAMKEAGTADGKVVIEKLHSMEFLGALGKIRFTENGDITGSPYVIWVTKNGKFEEYWKP